MYGSSKRTKTEDGTRLSRSERGQQKRVQAEHAPPVTLRPERKNEKKREVETSEDLNKQEGEKKRDAPTKNAIWDRRPRKRDPQLEFRNGGGRRSGGSIPI